ncbi:MAG: dihydroorotate dehydrogenase [Phycisphaerales bacterium]|nr:MAG: dihydroorotate dehydrogenase [Phycisphaerales bacterium]
MSPHSPPSQNASPLVVDLAGMRLKNPVILAAGTAGYVDELGDVLDLSRLGGLCTKSITREPRDGNATWRIIEDRRHAAMLNAIGLANVGMLAFERDYAAKLKAAPTTIIGSISEWSIEAFVEVAAMFGRIGVPAVELNVSCPNVAHGCEFGSDEALLRDLVAGVREALTATRLIVKLSPVVMGYRGPTGESGVVAIARAAIEARGNPGGPNQRPGADALAIANTVPAMAIDVHTRKPRLSRGSGGLSGPAIHPIAVKLVHDCFVGIARDTQTPIVGVGGVTTWEDAAEFILAGAMAVEMGTATFADPRSPLKVIKGLERWVRDQRVGSISDLVGRVG